MNKHRARIRCLGLVEFIHPHPLMWGAYVDAYLLTPATRCATPGIWTTKRPASPERLDPAGRGQPVGGTGSAVSASCRLGNRAWCTWDQQNMFWMDEWMNKWILGVSGETLPWVFRFTLLLSTLVRCLCPQCCCAAYHLLRRVAQDTMWHMLRVYILTAYVVSTVQSILKFKAFKGLRKTWV